MESEGWQSWRMGVKNVFNKVTSNRVITSAVLLSQVYVYWRAAEATGAWWRYGVSGVALAGAVSVFVNGWGVRIACLALALVAIAKVAAMFMFGFSWILLLQAIAAAVCIRNIILRPDSGILDELTTDDEERSEPPTEEEAVVSIVLLRQSRKYLEGMILADLLSDAWGVKLHGGEDDVPDDADGFVVGKDSVYMVHLTKGDKMWFMVHNFDSPYFNEAEDLAKMIPNLRLAEVIREHRAWLSMDLLRAGNEGGATEEQAYRWIGKAIAALADDDTQGLFCPQLSLGNLWSPALEEILAGDDPLQALRTEVKTAVVGVEDGELIKLAVAEARARWPEFVAAYQTREKDDERFLVKAPFSANGETEHMWMKVIGVEPEYVHGLLLNEPFHCRHLKMGAQVEVPVATVTDWICPDEEGNVLGNFTDGAVSAAKRAA